MHFKQVDLVVQSLQSIVSLKLSPLILEIIIYFM